MSLPQQDFTFSDFALSESFDISKFNTVFQSIATHINSLRTEVSSKTSQLSADGETYSGTATNATNLVNAPSLSNDNNQLKVTAGGKTSAGLTVAYATTAGSANSVAWSNVTGKTNLSDNNFTNTYKGYVDDLVNSSKTLKNGHTHSKLTFSNSSDGTTGDYDGSATKTIGYKSVLSTAQQNAVNSGITASKVSQYDGYNEKIDNRLFFIKQSSTSIINSDEAHLGRLRTGWTNSEYYEGVEVSDRIFLAFVNHGMPPDLSYKGRNWNNLAPFIYLLGI